MLEKNPTNTKVWNKDIRLVAQIISDHLHDPEMLLKKLTDYIQTARKDGFTAKDIDLH